MRGIVSKRGALLQKMTIQIVLVAIIVLFFVYATAEKTDSRYVKQQILEKQIALLIDAAEPGMYFFIPKIHRSGLIQQINVDNGRVHVTVEGFASTRGYPYYTRYSVSVIEGDDHFVIRVIE